MRFCMVTTFYPPYHFGGDAMYVYRLAQALARRGHGIDVLHDVDAYRLASRAAPTAVFPQEPGVRVFPMRSAFGWLSPLATQQTGRPWLKPLVRERLTSGEYDVVHFHNSSLIGSTAFGYGSSVKLYTLHEHWLICPMHVLWKFDREPCDAPACLACTLRGRRPPQLWRYTGRLERDLAHIDGFLSPSRFTRARHEAAALTTTPITVLPYFTPEPEPADPVSPHPRPYVLFVGRLVKLKGVDALLRVFRTFRDTDLLIVGDGDEAAALRAAAAELPHVHFLGARHGTALATLYRHATALVMPSIGYEVFGIVLIEAFSHRTPVIVRDLGGMPEAVEDSGGGMTFRTDEELVDAIRELVRDPDRRQALGERGRRAWEARWSEAPHLEAYLAIVDRLLEGRASSEATS